MADKKSFLLSDLDVLILSKEERESETEEKLLNLCSSCGIVDLT